MAPSGSYIRRVAIVIKTIKGRQYRYRQRSYRADGRVKTESVYIGPATARVLGISSPGSDAPKEGFLRRQFPRNYGIERDEIERQELARMAAARPAPKMEDVLGISTPAGTHPDKAEPVTSPVGAAPDDSPSDGSDKEGTPTE